MRIPKTKINRRARSFTTPYDTQITKKSSDLITAEFRKDIEYFNEQIKEYYETGVTAIRGKICKMVSTTYSNKYKEKDKKSKNKKIKLLYYGKIIFSHLEHKEKGWKCKSFLTYLYQ